MLLICLSLIAMVWGQGRPGGPIVQHNLNDPTLQDMANFVATSYSQSSNQQFTLGDNIKLIGAATQVVSGYSYHLTFELQVHHQSHVCDVTVWDQPWLHHREINSDNCAKYIHNKRQLAGAMHDVELTDEVKNAASFVADTLNARANTMYVQCLQAISGQKAQVVAGMIYEMDIILKASKSHKGGDVTATHNCVAPGMSSIQSCHVKVWDQPWRTPRYILQDVHCMALMS